MARITLPTTHIQKDGFHLRGTELARIDAFSDVVFGFALTLLVVSLEVPKTYSELHDSLRGFVPFAICFFFLMLVWHAHYVFFRRFGTHDAGTIVINSFLLFVILFYVYPLKFLFTVISFGMMGGTTHFFENNGQVVELMVIYSLGFAAVYLLIAALYWNAYRQRRALELSPLERLLTIGYILKAAINGVIGLLAALAASLVPSEDAALMGWLFLLIWPCQRLFKIVMRRRTVRLLRA